MTILPWEQKNCITVAFGKKKEKKRRDVLWFEGKKKSNFKGLLIQKVWNYKDIKFPEVQSQPIIPDYEICNVNFSYLLYISKLEAITFKKEETIYPK